MIKAVLYPERDEISLKIPSHYIGKKVEVLVFSDEESEGPGIEPRATLGEFMGILTPEEADELQEYVRKSREEWG